MTIKSPTGEPGRTPEVYHVSDIFKARVEEFLQIKEMELTVGIKAAVRCKHAKDYQKNPNVCPNPEKCNLCLSK
jgi:hypothetical protein